MKITDIITEAKSAHPQQAAKAIAMKNAGKKPKSQGMAEGLDSKVAKHNAAVAKLPGGQAHRSNHPDILKTAPKGYSFSVSHKLVPDEQGVAEGSQQVDSLVTDALKIMRGPELNDAVQALKTVLGDREFSSRRGHYNFYIRQLVDMYGQQGVAEGSELAEEFDLIESIVEMIAEHNGVDAEAVWEDLESLTEDELYVFAVTSDPLMESEAWQKANKKDHTDGMSQKAVNTYRREHPGSKLKTAVTTKPSKLKKGSKASKRRSSYCSRSRGQMKMHSISCSKTPDKAICKARRRWNC